MKSDIPTRNSQLATSNRSATSNSPRAFTLIEMLVVITIIILAMTLAIPAIRSLTGSRSQEAAQNTLASLLGFARNDAMALQRVEGIMFFLDTTTDRVECVAVMQSPYQSAPAGNRAGGGGDVAGVTYLDLVPDKDPLALPAGVWVWTLKDTLPTSAGSQVEEFAGCRYLGFNTTFINPNTQTNIPGGVILFDSTGRLTVRRYGFRAAATAVAATPSPIAQFIYAGVPNANTMSLTNWPSANNTSNHVIVSQIGICLFDRETFLAAIDPGTGTNYTYENGAPAGANMWFDANTTPIFVNRYDASLMRAE